MCQSRTSGCSAQDILDAVIVDCKVTTTHTDVLHLDDQAMRDLVLTEDQYDTKELSDPEELADIFDQAVLRGNFGPR